MKIEINDVPFDFKLVDDYGTNIYGLINEIQQSVELYTDDVFPGSGNYIVFFGGIERLEGIIKTKFPKRWNKSGLLRFLDSQNEVLFN